MTEDRCFCGHDISSHYGYWDYSDDKNDVYKKAGCSECSCKQYAEVSE